MHCGWGAGQAQLQVKTKPEHQRHYAQPEVMGKATLGCGTWERRQDTGIHYRAPVHLATRRCTHCLQGCKGPQRQSLSHARRAAPHFATHRAAVHGLQAAVAGPAL
jgi:hypothetical protein